jgi:hypothetical protein
MPPDPPIAADQPADVSADEHATVDHDVEIVDGMPVLAEVRTLEPSPPASLPAVQAAAAAATGFVAGAVTLVLARRLGARRLARARAQQRRQPQALPIAGTRSFLIDVHLLAKPGE